MSIPTWEEAAADEFWERVPTDLHEGAVSSYLGAYGDAIDARVSRLEAMATHLLGEGFTGSSIVASVAALEVMVQYFCIRPLIGGVFLSDLIAYEIAERIIGGRSCDQKNLLIPLLKPWGIDLTQVLLPDGSAMWDKIQTPVNKARNAFAHRGDDVSHENAALAVQCVNTFRKEVVLKIADHLEFTIDKTGCWSKVMHKPIEGVSFVGNTSYTRSDPFV